MVWDRAQEVNLRSVFLASKAAIPHMIEAGRGSIINTSSVQATRGVPGYPSYAAAKAGMQGLARQMAVDYAQHGIRINCVSPCVAGAASPSASAAAAATC